MNQRAIELYTVFDGDIIEAMEVWTLLGNDIDELVEVSKHFNTTVLEAVNKKPWRELIQAEMKRRHTGLLKRRDDLLRTYSTLTPFKRRREFYETKLPTVNAFITRVEALLRVEPYITWTPREVRSLKHLGTKNYLALYADRFFPNHTYQKYGLFN